MNKINNVLQLSLATMVTTVLFACSSTPERTQKNEFFVPVNQNTSQKTGSGTVVFPRGSNATRGDDGLKDSLMEMLRQQNKRLDNVVQNLNGLTKKDNTDNSKSAETLGDLLATRDRISYETLLEMVRDQNQRLNEVIEQLKLLSQNQSVRHSNLTARVDVSPVQKIPVHQVPVSKHLMTSFSYAKAIQLYENRQYEKAIDAFEQLLKRGIEPKFSDRYHFWMGVCYFNLHRGNQALNEFTEVLGYANSDKAESAYFMIGQCYERIGFKKNAKIAFEKLLQIYPRGSLKKITETKLALLK